MYATPAVVGAIAYTLLQLGHADLLFPDWVLLVVPFALTLSLRAAAWTYRRVPAARGPPPAPPTPPCARGAAAMTRSPPPTALPPAHRRLALPHWARKRPSVFSFSSPKDVFEIKIKNDKIGE